MKLRTDTLSFYFDIQSTKLQNTENMEKTFPKSPIFNKAFQIKFSSIFDSFLPNFRQF